ncbi:hypothetical protein HGRIS_010500 [Hohenbuehelia grisea]|uniref:Ubiquitin carboxyl-terminal hydrolase n=1 Tax=Hohenbuehelia grisea TaxID=104357 RepID=A0ABR3IXC0_9AGAR
MVPQPVKAVILLFPVTGSIKAQREEEDVRIKADGQVPVDPTVVWIKQTIGNACGTMALLHALANSDVAFGPQSALAKFIDQCKPLSPEERAHLLQTTPLFTSIHAETAATGQTAASEADMNTDLHFTVFVSAPEADFREKARIAGTEAGQAALEDAVKDADKAAQEGKESSGNRIIELDGDRQGPIDRGPCNDLLKDVAEYVKKEYIGHSSSVQFSMLALAPPA